MAIDGIIYRNYNARRLNSLSLNEHTFNQPGQGLPGTMVPTFEGGGAEDL